LTEQNNNLSTTHDDFDWSVDKRNVSSYNKADYAKYDDAYDKTFTTVTENTLIEGTVVGLTLTDAVVNIGFKSDGLIPLNEFRDLPKLAVGDSVEVLVMDKEDRNGSLLLSRKAARQFRAWDRIVSVYGSGEIVTGLVTSKTKGGLIVDLFGMETFLPGSQIDVKPVTDYDQFVGRTMEFKVVKVNELIKNAVVSHKALIESDIEAQRGEIMSRLEKGQVLEGTVKNVTAFGAFIDLGGLDGLLYITDISWGRINHPSDVLTVGDKINVVVTDFDDEKKRISLGMKQLTPHPWEALSETIKEGDVVKGKLVNIEDYGAFIEVAPGIEGLVHVSEITWSNQPINAKEYFKADEEYEAVVVSIDKAEHKMSLSIKKLTEDPWSNIDVKYGVDSKHKGIVKNITPYGVFVELEPGIGGMIHISDLSWTKRFNHPTEFTKSGDELDVIVLSLESETRKLSLGHKQLENDPWSNFESIFPIGSSHEGKVIRKEDKGAIVQLEHGLEAFCPTRHLRKEDEKTAALEETLKFIVLEFDSNEKRILVSHTRVWEQVKEDEKQAERKAAVADSEGTKKAVKNLQAKVEKATLGDISGFDALRKKLDGGESAE
jgi:small subunit ribosomal protein S1